MFLFLFWIFLSVLVGLWGSKRGHSGVASFGFALIFSPILAFIILFFWKGNEIKKCPSCAEEVKTEALKCKHCGHSFNAAPTEQDRIKNIEEQSGKLFK